MGSVVYRELERSRECGSMLLGAPLVQLVARFLVAPVGDESQGDHLDIFMQSGHSAFRLHAHANANGAAPSHFLLVVRCLEVRPAVEHVGTHDEVDARVGTESRSSAVVDPLPVEGHVRFLELAREQRHHFARPKGWQSVDDHDVTVIESRRDCTCRTGEDQFLDAEQEEKLNLHTHHQAHTWVERILVHVDTTAKHQDALLDHFLAVFCNGIHLSDLDPPLMPVEFIELGEAADFYQRHRDQGLDVKVIAPACAEDHCGVKGLVFTKT